MSDVTFTGVKNGRPTFDFGDRAPPAWLVAYANSGKVVDGKFVVRGTPLTPGQVITEQG